MKLELLSIFRKCLILCSFYISSTFFFSQESCFSKPVCKKSCNYIATCMEAQMLKKKSCFNDFLLKKKKFNSQLPVRSGTFWTQQQVYCQWTKLWIVKMTTVYRSVTSLSALVTKQTQDNNRCCISEHLYSILHILHKMTKILTASWKLS